MTRYARLIWITFLLTAAEIVTTRAVYYFANQRFQFDESKNFALALGFSTMGALGAIFSHRVGNRIGNRTTLMLSMGVNLLCDIVTVLYTTPATLVIGTLIKAACILMIWPIVEGYITAGLSPRETARALGGFNLAWTSAIPIMLAVSGWLIDHTAMGVFLVPMAIQLVVLYLFTTLEPDPTQLPDDHPSVLPASHEAHYVNMLRSARFTTLLSTAGLAFVNPLLPSLLIEKMGYTPTQATVIAAILDFARVVAILAMSLSHEWHGRRRFMILTILAIPVGLLFVTHGGSVKALIIGEILFGLASGSAYFAGLYYAMVVKRSSEGSAVHELLGQVGSLLGPGSGLAGTEAVKRLDLKIAGPVAGIMPVMAGLAVAALLPLRHHRPDPPAPPEMPELPDNSTPP